MIDAACSNWYEGVYRLLEAGADFRGEGADLASHAVMEDVPLAPETRHWKDKVLNFLEKNGVDLKAARREAEAKGNRTKKWEAGEDDCANSRTQVR